MAINIILLNIKENNSSYLNKIITINLHFYSK